MAADSGLRLVNLMRGKATMTFSITRFVAPGLALAVLLLIGGVQISSPQTVTADDQTLSWSEPTTHSSTVDAGDTISWVWGDALPHTVQTVAGPASFNSTLLTGQGTAFSFTFGTPGTYTYNCLVHPATMTGTVVVSAAQQATATPVPPTATTAATAAITATPTTEPTTAATATAVGADTTGTPTTEATPTTEPTATPAGDATSTPTIVPAATATPVSPADGSGTGDGSDDGKTITIILSIVAGLTLIGVALGIQRITSSL